METSRDRIVKQKLEILLLRDTHFIHIVHAFIEDKLALGYEVPK